MRENNDVIIALDFSNGKEVLSFLKKFTGRKPYVKVGMEMFYSEGPSILKEIKDAGHKIFLDLKLHDIPNTVKSAMAVLSAYDVDMVNLHASGTIEMMKAALEGLTRADGSRPLLMAVTQLTSTSEERMREELLINATMEESVTRLAEISKIAGLDGVICSPLESPYIHEKFGKNFLTCTPGVRFSDGDAGDQVRITTPEGARKLGSDFIVVGRPITRADDPVAAYERVSKEFLGE